VLPAQRPGGVGERIGQREVERPKHANVKMKRFRGWLLLDSESRLGRGRKDHEINTRLAHGSLPAAYPKQS
jgi:hypothetical protein